MLGRTRRDKEEERETDRDRGRETKIDRWRQKDDEGWQKDRDRQTERQRDRHRQTQTQTARERERIHPHFFRAIVRPFHAVATLERFKQVPDVDGRVGSSAQSDNLKQHHSERPAVDSKAASSFKIILTMVHFYSVYTTAQGVFTVKK